MKLYNRSTTATHHVLRGQPGGPSSGPPRCSPLLRPASLRAAFSSSFSLCLSCHMSSSPVQTTRCLQLTTMCEKKAGHLCSFSENHVCPSSSSESRLRGQFFEIAQLMVSPLQAYPDRNQIQKFHVERNNRLAASSVLIKSRVTTCPIVVEIA